MINVMLTDDHEMIREGIKALIEFDSKIHVVYRQILQKIVSVS